MEKIIKELYKVKYKRNNDDEKYDYLSSFGTLKTAKAYVEYMKLNDEEYRNDNDYNYDDEYHYVIEKIITTETIEEIKV